MPESSGLVLAPGDRDRNLSRPVTRPFLVRAAWTTLAIVVIGSIVRTMVGTVYHVDSGSMEPTLWGAEGDGEWVFVRFDRSPPTRNDIVVVRRSGEDTPIVKRVTGLPGESVRVSDGDLLVDHQRLRPSERRPDPIVVFDDRWNRVDERFRLEAAQSKLWRKEGDAWRLDATDVALESNAALLSLRDSFDDDYLGPDHELVRGSVSANDARVDCDVRFDDATGQVRVGLREGNDVFQAALVRVDPLTIEARLTRSPRSDKVEVLASVRVPFPVGSWTSLTLENRDNTVRLVCDALASPLVASYKENVPFQSDAQTPTTSLTDRVYLGGEGGRFSFRAIRLSRDLVYTNRGTMGVQSDVLLGPGEYFLLGDNSAQSRDSREWGPVRLDEIVGRPVAVVWPLSRWRRLRP